MRRALTFSHNCVGMATFALYNLFIGGNMEKLWNHVRIGLSRMLQRLIWLRRAWPFIVVVLLAVVHQLALAEFPASKPFVHKLFGTTMQVIGGLVVLYSLNDNLGLFRNKSFLSVFLGWWRDFPVFGRPITLSAHVSAQANASATASATIGWNPTTLEERVSALEYQMKDVSKNILITEKALNTRIDTVRDDLSATLTQLQTDLSRLTEKLEKTTVGGFKAQLFGVLLAIYGAGISVLT